MPMEQKLWLQGGRPLNRPMLFNAASKKVQSHQHHISRNWPHIHHSRRFNLGSLPELRNTVPFDLFEGDRTFCTSHMSWISLISGYSSSPWVLILNIHSDLERQSSWYPEPFMHDLSWISSSHDIFPQVVFILKISFIICSRRVWKVHDRS
jgi:hypothetical protein